MDVLDATSQEKFIMTCLRRPTIDMQDFYLLCKEDMGTCCIFQMNEQESYPRKEFLEECLQIIGGS